MKFFDDLLALFKNRPRTRVATLTGGRHEDPCGAGLRDTGLVYRVPLIVRVFQPGRADPVLVEQVQNIQIQDYSAPKFEDGRLVRDEREAGVYFDVILPPVHVDKSSRSHAEENRPAEFVRKTAGRRVERVPNYEDAIAG